MQIKPFILSVGACCCFLQYLAAVHALLFGFARTTRTGLQHVRRCYQQVTCKAVTIRNLDTANELVDSAIAEAIHQKKPVLIQVDLSASKMPQKPRKQCHSLPPNLGLSSHSASAAAGFPTKKLTSQAETRTGALCPCSS